jgi:pimeloyl-ACP methyl ester carboxylesterase
LIAHGTADRVISIDGGRRLFDSLPGDISKKWVVIPDAGHDNVLVTSYPIYADIAGWMLRHLADR